MLSQTTTPNESAWFPTRKCCSVRGKKFNKEDLIQAHRVSYPAVPFELFKAVMVEDRGIILEEDGE